MPTNPCPIVAAVKRNNEYNTHEYSGVSRVAKRTLTRNIPSEVKMLARKKRDADRKLINLEHRRLRGLPTGGL